MIRQINSGKRSSSVIQLEELFEEAAVLIPEREQREQIFDKFLDVAHGVYDEGRITDKELMSLQGKYLSNLK